MHAAADVWPAADQKHPEHVVAQRVPTDCRMLVQVGGRRGREADPVHALLQPRLGDGYRTFLRAAPPAARAAQRHGFSDDVLRRLHPGLAAHPRVAIITELR